MRSRFAALLVIAAALYTPNALAQSECGPGSNAPTLGEQNSTRNLSDRLAESKGVICPPRDVDPQMNAPHRPEGGGKIIPPQGGNPNVQPR